jgi:hypothetical protein
VFNPGEHVRGFTSPLQALVPGALAVIGFAPPAIGFVLAIAQVSLTSRIVSRLCRRLFAGERSGLPISRDVLAAGASRGCLGLASNLLALPQCFLLLTAEGVGPRLVAGGDDRLGRVAAAATRESLSEAVFPKFDARPAIGMTPAVCSRSHSAAEEPG